MVEDGGSNINLTLFLLILLFTEKPRTKPILKCGSPKNTSVFLGQNASMTCVVLISGTLPDFRWLKWNGIPSTYPESLDFENGSYTLVDPLHYKTVPIDGRYGVQMTIANVSKQDLGLYTCYVSNHLGSEYRSAFLTAKPDKKEIKSGKILSKCQHLTYAYVESHLLIDIDVCHFFISWRIRIP